MGTKKTLGGDRLGSGNRMKQEMKNFERSNKNLSTSFASTMTAGVLYPCYTNVALKGDTFDIDLNAFVRTVPTIGPLYGSFKLQIDFFQVPFRLYQAILHNNTVDIARKMQQVYLPKILIPAKVTSLEQQKGYKTQINTTALLRYLNISGVGKPNANISDTTISRKFLGIPMLAYYDIFKNYYSNKQEENAYVISPKLITDTATFTQLDYYVVNEKVGQINNNVNGMKIGLYSRNYKLSYVLHGRNLSPRGVQFYANSANGLALDNLQNLVTSGEASITKSTDTEIAFEFTPELAQELENSYGENIYLVSQQYSEYRQISLNAFPLSNIDEMRKYLLTQWDLGTEVVLSESNQNYLPYSTITGKDSNGYSLNIHPLNGLVVKTYQSDLFNNWLDTEWVNEITQNSAVDTSSGSFTIDALNFSKKLYNHLNRLALAGGTYDDWQEATYGEKVWGKSEKPIYCGGMSSEVVFDEVVSSAATASEPLGTIGGRGTLNGRKGGHMTIKVGEASVIMGVVSLTPRVCYTQGNAWYNTELDTMDDLHKPIFDRIGFQDLMVEQMAWWDTTIGSGTSTILSRSSAGKQPAWMNYATDIDRAYGDFADDSGKAFMVLSRNYEQNLTTGGVKDVTTYIDPQKFNYAFAYSELDSQNFWTFINMRIHARRKMSNTQIPNL